MWFEINLRQDAKKTVQDIFQWWNDSANISIYKISFLSIFFNCKIHIWQLKAAILWDSLDCFIVFISLFIEISDTIPKEF